MKEITLEATVENIGVATDFVEEFLDEIACPLKAKMQLNIAIDELFGNIAHYAYQGGEGKATVQVEVLENPRAVCITFIDSGVPYNPLEKADPDITLSAEDRSIGGLGIFMVKKNTDDMQYSYCEGRNRLKIIKCI
ncbi:MAG: ATP-binding protein [Anaerovibrio sp.]